MTSRPSLPQDAGRPWARFGTPACPELSAQSNFTFLTGASHPEEYVDRAGLLGIPAIAIADENSVAGIVRAHTHLREMARLARLRRAADADPIGPPCPPELSRPGAGGLAILSVPRLLPAARIVTCDGFAMTMLPRDRTAWGRLCRLLTAGRRRAPKGGCEIRTEDLLEWCEGSELVLHAPPLDASGAPPTAWRGTALRLLGRFGGHVSLMLAPVYDGQDKDRFAALERLAEALSRQGGAPLPLAASALPMMHHGARRRLADVLTAIRIGCPVERLGRAALPNAEQRLRGPAEMARLFAGYAHALDHAREIAARCTFSLDELRYEYPSETDGTESADQRLARLAQEGLRWRYPSGAPGHVRKLLAHELRLIGKLGYAPYFLTVNDIVAFARGRGILCQGRGSAANSVVCYCLGVTSVSPEIGTMVFERFVSEARDEPPDIDVDFEHERREEVIQYIYERYGRHRAGLCATVIHYRGKRAIREVGRAMGLSEDTLAALSSQLWGFFGTNGIETHRMKEIGLNAADPRLARTLQLIGEIIGFPRHLSQHVGGFVITEGRLDALVPVENAAMEERTVICWDKDDIDTLGILKVDILALGMLSCLRRSFDLIAQHHRTRYDLATLPAEDPATYDMLCQADSLGVFQVESRAQMNFLPRMRPRTFYDLVIEVAIIRPGPIQGDMLHPYLRRRSGEEEVSFPSDALGAVLGKTLGVPLFQEQAMQIAIVGAGFSPDEADRLRRALATFKKLGNISEFRSRFLRGMRQNGYDAEFSERCFAQIEGFGSYGFPESHAASFALLVYASAWIKRHHPGIFACALLNSQPMGFYAPAQIVRDAREHGVDVRPVCINASYWDCVMEPDGQGGLALRLGLRMVKALREDEARWLPAARGNAYLSVQDVWRRAGLGPRQLQVLAEADAFAGLGMSRRDAIWEAKALAGTEPLPLFATDMDGEAIHEPAAHLPAMSAGEQVVEDYVAMRLTLRAHPISFLRARLTPPAGGPPPATDRGDPPPDARRLSNLRGLSRSDAWAAPGEDGSGKCITTRD
ncbi:error-prone DNA polymerase [Profundibacterium mesophilum]|uniref:Error-prone DNA polymerase n=1 Tax=Profundibacterium mesophilum KAUST100406-0324 TaxID=1037889 RepID=A0A921TEG4_9RHOB|nr:error-prone DNA polymerase [Profundibacterium mesophilum]KAF0677292.1 DNA polymerase III subunit alpha [Profundibacterium mesophilum KAUST100406-0324]